MIKRPDNLVYLETRIQFNWTYFEELEIDLHHINKNRRSFFSKSDVEKLIEKIFGEKTLYCSDEKKFGEEFCQYFVGVEGHNDQYYKAVICICSDKPNTIGVITLHRIS